jgi:hypothetical protein
VHGNDYRGFQPVSLDALRSDIGNERVVAAIGNGKRVQLRQSIISMKPKTNFGRMIGKALWPSLLIFTCALSLSARNDFQAQYTDPGELHPQSVNSPIPGIPESSASNNRLEITRYVMDFEGDHSLDLATVVEQTIGTYSRYTVQLRLASGAEQSIDVKAPPGGLQLEMRDMNGDSVPNDLVLTPALLCWLPTILLNDGHDHFAVAVSVTDPDSLSSGLELESRGNDDQGTVALMSSGSKAGGLMNGGGLLLSQVQDELLSPTTQAIAQSLGYSSSSGRAPPALVITV